MEIRLFTSGPDIEPGDLLIKISGYDCTYRIDQNCVIVDCPVDLGIHILRVTSKCNKHISIVNVIINDSTLRDRSFYFSYVIDSAGKRYQPRTDLLEKDSTWCLPFMNPLGNWIGVIGSKFFKHGEIGRDLSENYFIFYPESIELPSAPPPIRDFFKYDFDFTVIPKTNELWTFPYLKYKKKISKELIDNAYQELVNKIDQLDDMIVYNSTFKEDSQEFNVLEKEVWQRIPLGSFDKSNPKDIVKVPNPKQPLKKLPECRKLIEAIDESDYMYSFIGILPPGAVGYPHIDDLYMGRSNSHEYQGCTQLYIPLNWPNGCYVKLANAGILPLENGPVVWNPDMFTHSLTNLSDTTRYVLVIKASKNILKNCEPYPIPGSW